MTASMLVTDDSSATHASAIAAKVSVRWMAAHAARWLVFSEDESWFCNTRSASSPSDTVSGFS